MRRVRYLVLALCAAIALLVLGIAFVMIVGNGDRRTANGVAAAGEENLVDAIGGPFTMVDDTGKTVTEADFAGKPTAIFFGFTHCPDVCPTTLYQLAGLMQKLGPDADRLNYVFVTVDPERDTPEVMHDYIDAFDERIVGLTGTSEQMDEMAKEYRVFYKRVPTDDGYTMDHTATVYLMDRDNRLAGTLDYHESEDVALQKLRNLIGNG